jgi:hypothetical protein
MLQATAKGPQLYLEPNTMRSALLKGEDIVRGSGRHFGGCRRALSCRKDNEEQRTFMRSYLVWSLPEAKTLSATMIDI